MRDASHVYAYNTFFANRSHITDPKGTLVSSRDGAGLRRLRT